MLSTVCINFFSSYYLLLFVLFALVLFFLLRQCSMRSRAFFCNIFPRSRTLRLSLSLSLSLSLFLPLSVSLSLKTEAERSGRVQRQVSLLVALPL